MQASHAVLQQSQECLSGAEARLEKKARNWKYNSILNVMVIRDSLDFVETLKKMTCLLNMLGQVFGECLIRLIWRYFWNYS